MGVGGEGSKLADMAYITGEAREQVTMFPVTLDELIPADHVCRVIEAFVRRLAMPDLGFVRSEPAETGRPGYDPRDLLKLYLYGYMNQLRSSRRLEAECQRNVEVMWLLGRLRPDYKSIAEFRRLHREAVKEAGAELVRLAREVGLVRGEWVAIDGSKFRAVSSAARVKEREAVQRYLDEMELADAQEEVVIDPERGAGGAGEVAQRCGAGGAVYADDGGEASGVQRADGGGCGVRHHRGARGDDGGQRYAQSAAHGGSGEAGVGRSGITAGGGRCGLLERGAGSAVRSAGDRAACAGQSRREPFRRWNAV